MLLNGRASLVASLTTSGKASSSASGGRAWGGPLDDEQLTLPLAELDGQFIGGAGGVRSGSSATIRLVVVLAAGRADRHLDAHPRAGGGHGRVDLDLVDGESTGFSTPTSTQTACTPSGFSSRFASAASHDSRVRSEKTKRKRGGGPLGRRPPEDAEGALDLTVERGVAGPDLQALDAAAGAGGAEPVAADGSPPASSALSRTST